MTVDVMVQLAIGQQFADAAATPPWRVMSASGYDATQATVGPCTCTHVRNRR